MNRGCAAARAAAFGVLSLVAACGPALGQPPASTTADVSAPTSAPPTPTPCDEAALIAAWPLSRAAAQTIVVPVDEANVDEVRTEVSEGAGGVILFGNTAPQDLGTQIASLTAAAAVTPFVMTDEEGGAVQRMPNLVGAIPSARQMGATMTASQIRALAGAAGGRMRAAGVSMDLAPVLDLDGGNGPDNHDPDGTRSFSTNPDTASADGIAFAEGLHDAGIVAVVKHFPGLGEATGNTDASPAATLPWSTLQGAGLQPFRAAIAAGIPAVMVTNATVPGLSAVPASISSAVISGVLRRQLGYNGLVITDSLSAGALQDIGRTVPQAAVAALEAGADLLLFSADAADVASVTTATIAAVDAAVEGGALPRALLDDAVVHVLMAKHVNLCG